MYGATPNRLSPKTGTLVYCRGRRATLGRGKDGGDGLSCANPASANGTGGASLWADGMPPVPIDTRKISRSASASTVWV